MDNEELLKRNKALEERIAMYEELDGITGLYYALQLSLNRINKALREAEVDLTDTNYKNFDKVMKAAIESKSIAENLKWLRSEFGLTGDEKKDGESAQRIIEQTAIKAGLKYGAKK